MLTNKQLRAEMMDLMRMHAEIVDDGPPADKVTCPHCHDEHMLMDCDKFYQLFRRIS